MMNQREIFMFFKLELFLIIHLFLVCVCVLKEKKTKIVRNGNQKNNNKKIRELIKINTIYNTLNIQKKTNKIHFQ